VLERTRKKKWGVIESPNNFVNFEKPSKEKDLKDTRFDFD
jgi:hypothetical protein